ncbi:hypothetical protein BDW71DRAFT_187241, partial [Aspergillus fruticulosus]
MILPFFHQLLFLFSHLLYFNGMEALEVWTQDSWPAHSVQKEAIKLLDSSEGGLVRINPREGMHRCSWKCLSNN